MGCKHSKEPPKLRLKPSVAQQMVKMDQERDLTSRFNSNGELSYLDSQPESSRGRKSPHVPYIPPPSKRKPKVRLRLLRDPNKVVHIEVQNCKGKVGLSSLHEQKKPQLSPSTTSSLSPRLTDSFNRTFLNRSSRPSDLSLTTSVSFRKSSPVLDPKIEELFVEPPSKSRSLFTAVRKSVPLNRKKPQAAPTPEESGTPARPALIPMLKEAAAIAGFMSRHRHRAGVRYVGSPQLTDDSLETRLSPVLQFLHREKTAVAHVPTRQSTLSHVSTLTPSSPQEPAVQRHRASRLWKWKGVHGPSLH